MSAKAKVNFVERASLFGIDINISLSPRQRGEVSPSTLRLALCAILAAVWEDCDQDKSILNTVYKQLL